MCVNREANLHQAIAACASADDQLSSRQMGVSVRRSRKVEVSARKLVETKKRKPVLGADLDWGDSLVLSQGT